jgi:hypothetical protein
MKPYTQFRVRDSYGGTLRAKKYDDGYFVFGKGRRNYGWRFESAEEMLSRGYSPVVKRQSSDTDLWHGRIRRALREIDNTGLWKGTDLETELRNMLQMTWEDHEELRELSFGIWEDGKWRVNPEIYKFKEKYPFVFPEDGGIDTSYLYERSACTLKPVYFGKYYTRRIRGEIIDATMGRDEYSSGIIPEDYDYSFEYRTGEDGLKRAWYSMEYRGCGNGHYYLALSERLALFAEND